MLLEAWLLVQAFLEESWSVGRQAAVLRLRRVKEMMSEYFMLVVSCNLELRLDVESDGEREHMNERIKEWTATWAASACYMK